MSITASELVLYGCADIPTSDGQTTGGAIDSTRRPVFSQITITPSASTVLKAASSSTSDGAKTVTIVGRDATGANVTDTITLSATAGTYVAGTVQFERVLSVNLSAAAVGTVTVTDSESTPATVATIPPGEVGFYALFQNASSGSAAINRYELVYWKNTDASLTLTSAEVTLTADPSGVTKIGLGAATGNLGTITNRTTAPAGITFVSTNTAQSLPGGSLAAGVGMGVWVNQSLAANQTALKSTFTLQLSGNTT